MNILIIDDEVDFSKELGSRLNKRGGHAVEIAVNGEEGWEKFSNSSTIFDLILTDVKMPLLDGIELLGRLRDHNYQIPVVIMTGHGDLDISIQALKLGAFDFLIKPFAIRELDSVMTKLELMSSSQQQFRLLLPQMRHQLQVSIFSQIALISPLINHLHHYYHPLCDLYRINSYQIDLCLYEALTNAVVHGNFGISSADKEESWEKFEGLVKQREAMAKYVNKQVILRFNIKDQQLSFEVEDEGEGFEDSRLVDLNNPLGLLSSGRGLMLIRSSMDEVSWNDSRNCIKMVKYLK